MKQSIVSEMTIEESEYDERLRKTEIRDPKTGCFICIIPFIILVISILVEIYSRN
ncbi:MAG: hypothetical protein Q8861_02120 [Bacteroidota bacterium]|nr:hypothetical protein [Bacteroidota bacterium]